MIIQVIVWVLSVQFCLVAARFCPWYDYDNPSGNGDQEARITRHDSDSCLRYCPYPKGQECKTTSGGPVVNKLLDGYDCSYLGLQCINVEQRGRNPSYCLDYKVRFDCHYPYEGSVRNPCYVDNNGCSQKCNFPSGSCSCHPGYSLWWDGKSCIGSHYEQVNYCTYCQEYFNSVECGEHTNLDAQPGYTLQVPCRKRCYKAFYDGRWSRGCGEYPPQYAPKYPFTSPPYNFQPPTSDPNYYSTIINGKTLQVWLSDGSLSNSDGGQSRLIGNRGLIGSPNHPSNYPNNMDMYYIVITRNAHNFGVFQAFNVESHYTCYWDYVEILNGRSTNSPRLYGRYCSHPDRIPPPFSCSSNTLPQIFTIHFHTDYSVTRSGFMFYYNRC